MDGLNGREGYDEEWVQLIAAAKEIGLSTEQVRHFLRQSNRHLQPEPVDLKPNHR
jgi:hypothetical protein